MVILYFKCSNKVCTSILPIFPCLCPTIEWVLGIECPPPKNTLLKCKFRDSRNFLDVLILFNNTSSNSGSLYTPDLLMSRAKISGESLLP